MWIVENWFNIIKGRNSNWEFFSYINSGWLEMQFKGLYGNNPTEHQQWEWMLKNAETIRIPKEAYDTLLIRLNYVKN